MNEAYRPTPGPGRKPCRDRLPFLGILLLLSEQNTVYLRQTWIWITLGTENGNNTPTADSHQVLKWWK
jgi:hypothetical protein